jgi:hypothetical protein
MRALSRARRPIGRGEETAKGSTGRRATVAESGARGSLRATTGTHLANRIRACQCPFPCSRSRLVGPRTSRLVRAGFVPRRDFRVGGADGVGGDGDAGSEVGVDGVEDADEVDLEEGDL